MNDHSATRAYRCSCLLVCFGILFFTPMVNAQSWQWARSIGGADADIGKDVCVDGDGSIYAAGWTVGNVTSDCASLNGLGGPDVLLTKYDPSGACLWSRLDGSINGDDVARGVTTDALGNVYVTGSFSDSAHFGTHTVVSNGGADMFIAKYDPDGNCAWVVQGGGPFDDQGQAIAVDGQGNVFACGRFRNTCIFGPATIGSVGSNYDVFLVKLDTAGTWQWVQRAGGIGGEDALGLVADEQGGCYWTGWFSSDIVSFGTYNLTSWGGADIFLARYGFTGQCSWLRGAGGPSTDQGNDLAIDDDGNVYLTGWISGDSARFDTHHLSTGHGPSEDAIVAKYDPTGVCLWAINAGGTGTDVGNGISLTTQDEIVISGYYSDVATVAGAQLTSLGATDVFVAAFDTSGAPHWGISAGGPGTDDAGKIAGLAGGTAYITGAYDQQATFGLQDLTSVAATDLFLAKVVPLATEIPQEVTASHFLQWDASVSTLIVNSRPSHAGMNDAYVRVLDAAGRNVLVRSVPDQERISLTGLPGGAYIAQLFSNGTREQLRVVVCP